MCLSQNAAPAAEDKADKVDNVDNASEEMSEAASDTDEKAASALCGGKQAMSEEYVSLFHRFR